MSRTFGAVHIAAATLVVAASLVDGVMASPASFAPRVGTTQIISLTGDATPDGFGHLSGLSSSPSLNDAGQAAFEAFIDVEGAARRRGVFRGDGGPLSQILRHGQDPDGKGPLIGPLELQLNALGQVAFRAFRSGTADFGIFRGNGDAITRIAEEGELAPDGNGYFYDLASQLDMAFNDLGQVAFSAGMDRTSGTIPPYRGIFRGDGGPLTQIARRGQMSPDGNFFIDRLGSVSINNVGEVSFNVELIRTPESFNDGEAILRGDGNTLTTIVLRDQVVPDGNGKFRDLYGPQLNDAGQVAFRAELRDTAGGHNDDFGLFRYDDGALIQIARKGQPAPDNNGTFSFMGHPVLNELGAMVFAAELSNTSGGSTDSDGIFYSDSRSLTQIARTGRSAPGGNGLLEDVYRPALNDAGQVAFVADLSLTSGGANDDKGIFFFNGGGLIEVARTGNSFLGSTIFELYFNTPSDGDEQQALNEFGQLAYAFLLADGRSGIAIWTIPEPTAIATLCIATTTLLASARRQYLNGFRKTTARWN